MPEMPARISGTAPANPEVAPCPPTTEDGRPFVPALGRTSIPGAWLPEPLRDGDPLYADGTQVGSFHGNPDVPFEWYIDLIATKDMPLRVRDFVRALPHYQP